MSHAAIGPISIHLPERIETNELLKEQYPAWDLDVIASKTGIRQRHIAEPHECSSDLGVAAAKKLFADYDIDPASIDFIFLCTQSPDYPLPTTACLIQDRLGLSTRCGAMDFNLGCSGYVYGLSLADGLIQSGACRRILFITAETYSKFIHESDRSLRTIFGDGATATLIEAADQPSMLGFEFGTDGSGADTLLVTDGGHRSDEAAIRPRHRKRWPSQLYMDGPSLLSFTVAAIPPVIDNILSKANLAKDDIDLYLMHQATVKLLDQMRQALELPQEKMPIYLETVGNTVSCTIPLLIDHLRQNRSLSTDRDNVMVGFGVGWSWAGCVWRDITGGKPITG